MIILSKVLKESNQIKILAIRVAAKRTLDNALLLIRETLNKMPALAQRCATFEDEFISKWQVENDLQNSRNPQVLLYSLWRQPTSCRCLLKHASLVVKRKFKEFIHKRFVQFF